jgi:hypothetical protein
MEVPLEIDWSVRRILDHPANDLDSLLPGAWTAARA